MKYVLCTIYITSYFCDIFHFLYLSVTENKFIFYPHVPVKIKNISTYYIRVEKYTMKLKQYILKKVGLSWNKIKQKFWLSKYCNLRTNIKSTGCEHIILSYNSNFKSTEHDKNKLLFIRHGRQCITYKLTTYSIFLNLYSHNI